MDSNTMFTIELNLDDDVSSTCAYHISDLENTCRNNLEAAITEVECGRKISRWVLIGVANTHLEAKNLCAKYRNYLCRSLDLKPKDLEDRFEQFERSCVKHG